MARRFRIFWVQVNNSGRWHQTSPFNGRMTRCGLVLHNVSDDDLHEWLSGGALQCKRCWNTNDHS